VKFVINKKQVEYIRRIEESFAANQNPALVASALGGMCQGLVEGDCTSISISVYRDELQVTFWEKKGKGSEVLASFTFSSADGFIAGYEELA
jgi:hypothetical protein